MNSLFVLSCLTTLATLASRACANEDYCALTCLHNGRWRDNVGCNKNEELGPLCSNDTAYKLTKTDRKLILHLHNEYRNQIAGGDSEFPKAARMLPMQWDDEHAKLAFYNVKDCTGERNKCHKTEKYNNPGQNHYFHYFDAFQRPPFVKVPSKDFFIKLAFSTWKSKSNPLIFDHNFSVGCSYVFNSDIFHLVCNYPFNPKEAETGEQIYKVGSAIAEDCSEKNKRYHNLCVQADADREIENYEKP